MSDIRESVASLNEAYGPDMEIHAKHNTDDAALLRFEVVATFAGQPYLRRVVAIPRPEWSADLLRSRVLAATIELRVLGNKKVEDDRATAAAAKEARRARRSA